MTLSIAVKLVILFGKLIKLDRRSPKRFIIELSVSGRRQDVFLQINDQILNFKNNKSSFLLEDL